MDEITEYEVKVIADSTMTTNSKSVKLKGENTVWGFIGVALMAKTTG